VQPAMSLHHQVKAGPAMPWVLACQPPQ
jgi:hypothetical protein